MIDCDLMKRRRHTLNTWCRRGISLFIVGMLWLPTFSVLGQQDTVNDDPQVTIHVVQRGETLFRIAENYGLTLEEIAQVNQIADPGSILIGQRLIIPIGGLPESSVEVQTHVVQPGETLTSIAELYGMAPDALALLNNIALTSIIVGGQTLEVSGPNASQAGVTIAHVVERGESLFSIATQYGTTIEKIQEANDIEDPTLIFADQTLTIPDAQPPRIAPDLPEVVTSVGITPVFFTEGQSGRVRMTTGGSAAIVGRFLDHDLTVIPNSNNTEHTILIAIPMYTRADVYPMHFTVIPAGGQSVSVTINVRILTGGYDTQDIELPEDRLDLLNPAVEDNELSILRRVTSAFNPERYFDGPLSLPAAAVMNEPYGTHRSYNGGPVDRYHNGADFAGVPGTPVLAAAPGRVVLADTLYIRGNAVVIDHGWGVYTNYAHMDERYVELGQFVSTGDTIGTIGNTGRATGAHLHWEVWLNGVAVDPMQWVRQSFP